jgi:hypothetical protein
MLRADRKDCSVGQRSQLEERFEQFSSIVLRIRLEFESPQQRQLTRQVEDLWKRRWILVREIVATPAVTIEDARLKAAIVSSLISNGELRIGLTSQCVEDYDRVIAANSRPVSGLDAPEPRLWSGYQRIRDAIVIATSHQSALEDSWWREFTTELRAIAGYEAKTSFGFSLKGKVLQEVLQFASEADGLIELQLSYLQDFEVFAHNHSEIQSAQIDHGSV